MIVWTTYLGGLMAKWEDRLILFLMKAIYISAFMHGSGDETCVLRRNVVRYMVLTQASVLRSISMQVRKRFPTFGTFVTSGKLEMRCSALPLFTVHSQLFLIPRYSVTLLLPVITLYRSSNAYCFYLKDSFKLNRIGLDRSSALLW
ncbi:Bestrophin -like protein 22 [Toxocara canis]|uniref:Bestrophin homolog n=1 Tax=Toxocara canis TaxID=6265 RepID=A0A0B2VLB6_TOXCA|nr:Bestrophin -like protein 22 [Toxocara canis]